VLAPIYCDGRIDIVVIVVVIFIAIGRGVLDRKASRSGIGPGVWV
jgi:hypothetical protein